IYAASTFLYRDIERMDAALAGAEGVFVYGRYGNPTTEALETAIAALEEQEAALAFGSGMAALHATILSCVETGDRIVASRDLYGQTISLLRAIFSPLGIETTFVDVLDLDQVEAALRRGRVRLVLCETISNPLLRVTDLPALTELAHRYGARVAVDNTFATPYLVRPGTFGADYVIHSATKYLGGHGDVTAGLVATAAERRWELNEINKTVGSILGPFEAYLVLRGLKTLPLRMRAQCENAIRVANWLVTHPAIERVYFPGLPTHPSHDTAVRLFPPGEFGAMVAFDIRGATRDRIFTFLQSLELIIPATTLGDVYSEVLYPVMASHRGLSPEERQAMGIGEGLVRLSVGIEDAEDIIADLERALAQIAEA
ncbi:MAG: PLP-dependent aspartate aminotransferase family protein, partial [Thermomicrobium sp.]|nr:PLP-dependent aspartate aminotransferase family protein [Thermomicrobium sp.]